MQIFYNYTTIAGTNHRTNLLCLFSFIYIRKSNILYLRVSTSGAGWSNGRLGACSQSRTYCEQTIARQRGMSMERKRNANGTARKQNFARIYERCRMEQRAAGSLLTKPHILRTDDSATARHEHGALAECEWHRSDKQKVVQGDIRDETCRIQIPS